MMKIENEGKYENDFIFHNNNGNANKRNISRAHIQSNTNQGLPNYSPYQSHNFTEEMKSSNGKIFET